MSKPKKWDSMTPEEQEAWRINQNERKKRYSDKNKDQSKERHRKWRGSNRDRINKYSRATYHANKERHSEWVRRWRKKNPDKCREISRKSNIVNKERRLKYSREWWALNREKQNEKNRNSHSLNPGKSRMRNKHAFESLPDSYVSSQIGIPVHIARQYPDLIEAKREQLKILRELKPTKRKQTQCTRIQHHCNKSATTSQKPPTPHGSTSLLSLELSSWSTPWVRQLTQLLLKSKRQS